MAKFKSARHHWWPECVSQHWKDDQGCVNWLSPTGEVRRAPPKNFGLLGNGHAIKLGSDPAVATPWDENYEAAFQRADTNFPNVIAWLESLPFAWKASHTIRGRFISHSASDAQIAPLVEGLVSLAVRSPCTRQFVSGLSLMLDPAMSARDRNNVIGLNLRHAQSRLTQQIGVGGKFVAIYSPDREFIFGDGFGHNLNNQYQISLNPRILAPITPRIAVLWARPSSFMPDPRLTTLVVTAEEADAINLAVQVYAKDALFYRSDKPEIHEAFIRGQHLAFKGPDNAMDDLIHNIPGAPPRDPMLDELRAMFPDLG